MLQTLIPYRKGNKWGFCDKDKNIIIPCKYNYCYMEVVENKIYGCSSEDIRDFEGRIDVQNNEIIPCVYEYIYDFEDKLFFVLEDKTKFAIFDSLGNQLSDFVYCNTGFYKRWECYEQPCIFKEGLAIVKSNITNKFGFINEQGVEIIPCIYDSVEPFKNSTAWVKRIEYNGYIDINGKEFYKCEKKLAFNFIKVYDKYDYYALRTEEGKLITPYVDGSEINFDIEQFSFNLWRVIKTERIGEGRYRRYIHSSWLIDANGNRLTNDKMSISSLYKGKAKVVIYNDKGRKEKVGYIDLFGKIITSLKDIKDAEADLDYIFYCSNENVKLVYADSKYGYIGKDETKYWED